MSPLVQPFRHCPACARAATRDDPRVFVCEACGFRYYHNVAAAVAAFIVHGDEVLLTRRARAPAAGTLDLPGGFVDPHESLEAALVRELAEELALHIPPETPRYLFSLPNLYDYADITYATADSFYRIDCATRPRLAARDDVSEVLWVPAAEIDLSSIGLASARAAVARFKQAL